MDYSGNDIALKRGILHWEECATLCKETESCTHWTWSMHDEDWGKYCWLKFSSVGWKKSRDTISGEKNCTSECEFGLEDY